MFLGLEVSIQAEPSAISNELAKALVDLTIETFKSRKGVFDEGFMLLSGLCAWLEK